MHFLFEKRLGHTLYWVTEEEWFKEGYYWCVNDAISRQLLLPPFIGYMKKHDWHYNIIKYREFLERCNEFDACLVLMQTSDPVFARLIRDKAPHMKLIRHIGNPWEVLAEDCARNIIFSITPSDFYCKNLTSQVLDKKRNWVFAHQEFDTTKEFTFVQPKRYNRITSYQGGILFTSLYLEMWNGMKSLLPEFEWLMYGATGSDLPSITLGSELAQSFQDTSFVWQTKAGEDGGGHLTHNAFATGRPLICRKSWYGGMMLDMLVDGVTCVDLDSRRSPAENAEFIRQCANPARLESMSRNVYDMFKGYCDYAKEAEQVRWFMEKLQ